jgi:hypothetical protein
VPTRSQEEGLRGGVAPVAIDKFRRRHLRAGNAQGHEPPLARSASVNLRVQRLSKHVHALDTNIVAISAVAGEHRHGCCWPGSLNTLSMLGWDA